MLTLRNTFRFVFFLHQNHFTFIKKRKKHFRNELLKATLIPFISELIIFEVYLPFFH